MVRQVKETHTGKFKHVVESMAWGPMVGLHGGNERVALEGLKRGDIIKVKNEKTGKMEYAIGKTLRPVYIYIYIHTCICIYIYITIRHIVY